MNAHDYNFLGQYSKTLLLNYDKNIDLQNLHSSMWTSALAKLFVHKLYNSPGRPDYRTVVCPGCLCWKTVWQHFCRGREGRVGNASLDGLLFTIYCTMEEFTSVLEKQKTHIVNYSVKLLMLTLSFFNK